MDETENILQISSYNDFIQQLNKVKNSESSVIISFYKYCWLYADEKDFNTNKDSIINELKEYGLEPFIHKVTEDMNIILRYENFAEAVMLVKPYQVDIALLRLMRCST